MRYCFVVLLLCGLMPVNVSAQKLKKLEATINSILEDLKNPEEEEALLPPNAFLAELLSDGEELIIHLDISDRYLNETLDEETHEEIIEHFSRPIHDFGYTMVIVKAMDRNGKYIELSKFIDSPGLAGIALNQNDDPVKLIQGRISSRGSQLKNKVIPEGQLKDCTVWLSAGHGWKYDHKRNSYRTQRHNTFGVVEDFATIEMVNYHLLKYLYHAGGNVWTVRERDMNTHEVIVDNDHGSPHYKEIGNWYTSTASGHNGGTYRYAFSNKTENAAACFQPQIPASGQYWVSVKYRASLNRSADVRYKIIHAGGESQITINQETHGDTWVYLGQFYFEKGTAGRVVLINESSDPAQAIIADAVRFGGGMGEGTDCQTNRKSGAPRFEEAAQSYAPFQGYPDCVNDVMIRPYYAEWELSKGNELEKKNAVYVSIHTNGSGGKGTETYLHRYRPVPGSWSLRHYIHGQLIADLKDGWDQGWVDRGMKSADFGELRGLRTMPGIIVELGFHDNPLEAKAITDPKFRDLTARAIYKGIVRYFANKKGEDPIYLPEPPTHLFALNQENGQIQLSWKKPKTGGIYGHQAQAYKIYISKHGKAFADFEQTRNATFTFDNLAPSTTYYFRVAATNKGGESFPSAVVAVRTPPRNQSPEKMLIVDGFDRLDRGLALVENMQKPSYAPLGKVHRLAIEKMNDYNYASDHAFALAESNIFFDGATNEAVEAGLVQLNGYYGIDWFVGRESSTDKTLSAKEQQLLKRYLDDGGQLIISGSELGYDLDHKKNGRSFYRNYLKATYKGDDANTDKFYAHKGHIFSGINGHFNNNDYGYYSVTSPDIIAAHKDAHKVLLYPDGNTAAISYKGQYNLVHFAFPLETIGNEDVRNRLFQEALAFMDTGSKIHIVNHAKVPNGFENTLVLELEDIPTGKADFRLLNAEGLEVFQYSWSHKGKATASFNLQKLPAARYQYEFEWGGNFERGYVVKW